MAKKPETKFSDRLCKVLESQCAFIINQHGHLFQKSGVPDLQVIHRRWHGFLELKMNKNKPSPIQKSVAAAIELRGVPVYVFRCVEHRVEGMYTSIIDPPLVYTIEDFKGNIIADVGNLDGLLDILVGLDSQLVGGFDEVNADEQRTCGLCGNTLHKTGICMRCDLEM